MFTNARVAVLLPALLVGAAQGLGLWASPTQQAQQTRVSGAVADARAQQPLAAEPFEVVEATIPQMQAAMASGRLTAARLVELYVARIEAYDRNGPKLNALLFVNCRARATAALLDEERRRQGPRGPLHGIPVVLKDNYDTADMPTTGGSIALAGSIPPEDAFQVRKLREAGAIVLAKANLDEFAAGGAGLSSLGGRTLNPYDLARRPGGSSTGTAVAVSANLAAVGWGTDTCGSITIPSSINSLFGIRPTAGLFSRGGVWTIYSAVAAAPMARTVTDLAIALDATIGPDPRDPATRMAEGHALPRFTESLDVAALRGARLGLLTPFFGQSPDEREVTSVVLAAVEQMKAQGAEVVEVVIPDLESALSEARSGGSYSSLTLNGYLAQTPGAPVRTAEELAELGLYHTAFRPSDSPPNRLETGDSTDYYVATAKRAAFRDVLVRALDEQRLDALVYPSMRRKPDLLGEPYDKILTYPDRSSGSDWGCRLSATSGLPALSMPAGFTDDELPVGLTLLGRPFADDRLVALAYAFEQATHHRRPPLKTTPPLISGRAPSPTVTFNVTATGAGWPTAVTTQAAARATFTFDGYRNTLSFSVQVSGVPADQIHAVTLDRGEASRKGPVVYRLLRRGETSAADMVVLTSAERRDLLEGRLYMTLYTADHPTGAALGRLVR
ncbi:MAG: CHRD domain-containing protein [Gemmatimonadetes bacterium]|nr:CHRD domain-containing protein [Gemmatimonadota bacterium]